MTDYMSMVMREVQKEAVEREIEARYYKRMHFINLVRKAEFMEEKGEHLDETAIGIMETASHMSLTPESRHRMSKEIAEELIQEYGETAHLYALEKVANDTSAPRLWRDVLTYLDELTGEKK